MTTAYEARTRQAQERLSDVPGEALVLAPGPEQQYLSGFATEQSKRHTLLVVPTEGDPFFFVPEMYAEDVREASWVGTLHTWGDTDDPVEELGATLAEHGLDGDVRLRCNERMWTAFSQDLRRATDGAIGLAGDLLAPLRMVKDDTELGRLRRGSEIADAVSEAVRRMTLAGMTENEVAAEIEYEMRGRGAGGAAFETIVASGPNSARPAYRAGTREIEPGDPVVLDFGAAVEGYLSDQTRTVVVGGEPPEGFREVHDAVRDAQDAAVAAVEPGVPADTVDAAAREVLEDAGYADRFPHVTGHGVGLDIHEPPFLIGGTYLEGWNEVPLEPGMVFSVEPAVYTDEWGVRIEDLVVVTDDGCERLNHSDRGWAPL